MFPVRSAREPRRRKIPPGTLTPFACVVWGVGEAFYGKTSLFIWQLLLRRAAKIFSSSSLFRSVRGLLLYLEEEVVLFSRQGQSGQRRVRRKHRTEEARSYACVKTNSSYARPSLGGKGVGGRSGVFKSAARVINPRTVITGISLFSREERGRGEGKVRNDERWGYKGGGTGEGKKAGFFRDLVRRALNHDAQTREK